MSLLGVWRSEGTSVIQTVLEWVLYQWMGMHDWVLKERSPEAVDAPSRNLLLFNFSKESRTASSSVADLSCLIRSSSWEVSFRTLEKVGKENFLTCDWLDSAEETSTTVGGFLTGVVAKLPDIMTSEGEIENSRRCDDGLMFSMENAEIEWPKL